MSENEPMMPTKPAIVVKIGGSTLGSHDTALVDVAALHAAGERIVLAHGGGSAATEWLKLHNVTSEFVDGLRVTGADSIDVVVAVFAGLVNKQLVTSLRALGAPAFGLCGVDGGVLPTRQLDPRLEFVGEVIAFERKPLDLLLDAGYLPVLAPIGFWQEQPEHLMNLNADTVAGEVASGLAASDLIFLTDVAHVMDGSGNAIAELRSDAVDSLIAEGVASGGMIPKLQAAACAASKGVRSLIVDGREANALSRALQGSDIGTMVTV